jgi:hypothetical protein
VTLPVNKYYDITCQDRAEHIDKIKGDSPNSLSDPPTQLRKCRQPALMVGPDIKILVVWLENFQDHENFPTGNVTVIIDR